METRKITAKEAEACANEEVQFIGTIQPHGFCVLVDAKTEEIIQYSANFLLLLNSVLSSPLALDTPILNTKLSQWLDYDRKTLFQSLLPKATQTTFFTDLGLISSEHWECLGSITDEHLCFFEFFPTSKELSSHQLLSNLDHMVAKIRLCESLPDLFEAMTDEFQKNTGYDRVMLYKFLPDWGRLYQNRYLSKPRLSIWG
ncbi:MAG: hypothetical protein P1U39_01905 [Legionellaceae bacterium]|jgi:light-regulated signal transduction histidine kinase (bacteriophytochrome)|nr:hypothetical protein [Legionellaceae bacterium]